MVYYRGKNLKSFVLVDSLAPVEKFDEKSRVIAVHTTHTYMSSGWNVWIIFPVLSGDQARSP